MMVPQVPPDRKGQRVQMGRKALDAPGEARPDWWITQEIAKSMGLKWKYRTPADVFAEMKQAMPSLNNITWPRLEKENSVTYPCPAPGHPVEDIVFADRFATDDGLGKFVPANVQSGNELPDRKYPFILITGRQLEHWHTGAMTRRSYVLDQVQPSPTVQMNTIDIAKFKIEPGDKVKVSTRRGEIEIAVRADNAVSPGTIFIPFAYVEAAANELTNPQLDPIGKIPEFKFCAAKVEPLH